MKLVQLIFVGDRILLDRHKVLLRRFIPHKVYFVHYLNFLDKEKWQAAQLVERKLKQELPRWVARQASQLYVPPFEPEKAFPQLLRVMVAEKKKGNEVIVNLHGAPNTLVASAFSAAALANAKTYYVEIKSYEKGKAKIGKCKEIRFPFLPQLPKGPESAVLLTILKNKCRIQSKLAKVAELVGLNNLGNIKKASSATVKLSKILSKLKTEELVVSKKISRKVFEIALTQKGQCMAEILEILNNKKRKAEN